MFAMVKQREKKNQAFTAAAFKVEPAFVGCCLTASLAGFDA